jgi:uncharacterized integral membrane protein
MAKTLVTINGKSKRLTVFFMGTSMALLKKLWWLLIAIIAIWLGVWVVIDNPEPVTFKLFGFDTKPLPSGLWLLATFAIGCVVALLASSPALIRLGHRVKRLNKQLVKLKASTVKTPDTEKLD